MVIRTWWTIDLSLPLWGCHVTHTVPQDWPESPTIPTIGAEKWERAYRHTPKWQFWRGRIVENVFFSTTRFNRTNPVFKHIVLFVGFSCPEDSICPVLPPITNRCQKPWITTRTGLDSANSGRVMSSKWLPFPQTACPHWGVSYGKCQGRCLIRVLTLVCGILPANFRIKWLLRNLDMCL